MNETDAGDVEWYIEVPAKVMINAVHEEVENWGCCRARFRCCWKKWLALPAETNGKWIFKVA